MADFIEYLDQWLPRAPARLLEVGAGCGDLAARLRGHGYEVVAIDPHAHGVAGVEPVAVEGVGDSMGTFHAVVAQRSLHHVDSLEAAMASITTALRPGGLLVVQDFGWDLVDDASADWMHAELERLRHEDVSTCCDEWLDRFRSEHEELATFGQLEAALDSQFLELHFEWVPYLAVEYLDADPAAQRLEQSLLERGEVQPAAFRYVGATRATGGQPLHEANRHRLDRRSRLFSGR